MIGIIIGLFILVAVIIVTYKLSPYDRAFNCALSGFLTAVLLFILVPSMLMPLTGGCLKNYGVVNQVGYLTNFSERGIFWKTYEGELQKGVGEQATAENSFRFSVTDKNVIKKLSPYLGSKHRLQLECRQWFCMPYSRGSTDKEVVGVREIE